MLPKIFLSHSSLDKGFVEKFYGDLKTSQIDPWYDTVEIRAGKPWLQVIFGEGLPACDAVFVYFTEKALSSPMVGKEVDSSLIQQMSENRVGFLPYVESEAVRKKLRSDIQGLHCPVFNLENYSKVLPSIIGEIWRTYHEKSIPGLIAIEKAKRLELELKIKDFEEKSSSGIFSIGEELEYNHITEKLNKPLYALVKKKTGVIEKFEFLPLELIFHSLTSNQSAYHFYLIRNEIYARIGSLLQGISTPSDYSIEYRENMHLELQMCGFLDSGIVNSFGDPTRILYFSKKMFRYRYWLDYYGKLPTEVTCKRVEF